MPFEDFGDFECGPAIIIINKHLQTINTDECRVRLLSPSGLT